MPSYTSVHPILHNPPVLVPMALGPGSKNVWRCSCPTCIECKRHISKAMARLHREQRPACNVTVSMTATLHFCCPRGSRHPAAQQAARIAAKRERKDSRRETDNEYRASTQLDPCPSPLAIRA